jgi:hypothetical protein
MKNYISTFSVIGKALHAHGQARRHDPALPKPVPDACAVQPCAGRRPFH